jgi:hypothetical protein
MRIKTSLFIFTVLAALFAFTACKDDNPISNKQNPYTGNWKYTFAGSQVGSGNIKIGTEGQISTVIQLQDASNNTVKYTIKATVNKSGKLTNGKILQHDSVTGALNGSFNGDSGSGKWHTAPDTLGTWTANRLK